MTTIQKSNEYCYAGEPVEFSENDYQESLDLVSFDFGVTRRGFVQVLGAGLLVTVIAPAALGQRGRGRQGSGRPALISARIHIAKDGRITVLTGKIEEGQGARTELTQAAAEELRVPVARVNLTAADTDLTPNDGTTAGSMTTPRTVPPVRQAAAAARLALVKIAAERWGAEAAALEVRDGKITDAAGRSMTYADLAGSDELAKALDQAPPADVAITPPKNWKILGTSVFRPNARDLVTGAHKYPSDVSRPGMLHGKVLRPPAYGAKLVSVDLAPAKAMKDVVAVQDGQFAGVAAPTTDQARKALEAIAPTAKWDLTPQPSSKEIFGYLRKHIRGEAPKNPYSEELASAAKVLKQTYDVAYVQHTPMETRAALAEWDGDKLTVWTGSSNAFGCRSELARAFRVPETDIRVIVPDFGGGFGGKHTGEAGVEAAQLARAAGKPVSLKWTREEEFAWAYFRPAAVIDIEASLDKKGMLTSWHYININSGQAAIDTPYKTGKKNCRFVQADSPLRQSSYRALAATANNFARECFMDELAGAAGMDPLDFRLAHLDNPRIRTVLEEAAKQFNWREKVRQKQPGVGYGLACGIEKNSVVAACAEIAVDQAKKAITVRHVCEAFECGAILNPANLTAQVQGCIIMGMGPALREEMQFENGAITNGNFKHYLVPRFTDVPELDLHLLNRPDQPSAGAGETPIIAIAPAIANAVFHATGARIRQMPIRLPATA